MYNHNHILTSSATSIMYLIVYTISLHPDVGELRHVAGAGDGVPHLLPALGPAPADQQDGVVVMVQVQAVAAPHTQDRVHEGLA